MNYKIVSLAERYDLFETQDKVCCEVWSEFMLHSPVADAYWMQFIEAFKDYQLLMMERDDILAVINTVPIHFDKSLHELPDEGWDWGVRNSIATYQKGIKPNLLMGVQIVVNKNHQGKGLSALAVKEMANLARKKEFNNLVIAVRPSDKHHYPLIPIENYIKWQNENNLPFDNWLRVHAKAGGKIIKPCPKSMAIPGTISEWKAWTNMDFPGSGSFIIPGALNPISIDLEKELGLYIEPNVWICHKIVN